jgi:hypothetical protein
VKTNVKVLILCLGLSQAAPLITLTESAEAAESVTSAQPRPLYKQARPPFKQPVKNQTEVWNEILKKVDSDPVQNWLDKNAERFGLIAKPKEKQLAPFAEPKSQVYRRSDLQIDRQNDKSKLQSSTYIDDGFGGYRILEPNRKVFTPPPAALKTDDAAKQISAVMDDLNFNNVCAKFATKSGFGTWGNLVIDELMRGRSSKMLAGTDDLRQSCPAYDYLGAREKTYVWVKIFAAMAFMESSCDPSRSAQGPNGIAAGLLQLHEGSESDAAPGCNNNDSKSAVRSLKCGLSIVETQIARTGRLFSKDTHFGVLRVQGDLVKGKRGAKVRVQKYRLIVGALKELPFCRR